MPSSERQEALQLTPYKPDKNVVWFYRSIRCLFVTTAFSLGAFAFWRLLPMLDENPEYDFMVYAASATFFAFAGFLFWAAQPVGPSFESQQRSKSDKTATFCITPKGWLLCEPTEQFRKKATADTLFVLYCCPKLDPTQYASLAKKVAEQGICTLLVQPALGLFFAKPAIASDIIQAMSPTFKRYVLGGHDMGAQFAIGFAQGLSGKNELAGLVLLGALVKTKKNNLSAVRGGDGELPVALVNASRDKLFVQHIDMRCKGSVGVWKDKTRLFVPGSAYLKIIKDGNHFGYADSSLGYLEGFISQDNKAFISRAQQQKETALVVYQVATCSPANPLPTGQ